jgi:hypothetical protein
MAKRSNTASTERIGLSYDFFFIYHPRAVSTIATPHSRPFE